MAESHVISALIKKRSELSGEIEHYEKIIKECRENLTSIDKTIHIFDETYDLRTVKSKRVIRNNYFSSGEATKMVLDVLRTANEPIKTDNLIDVLAEKKSFHFKDRKERYAFSKTVSVTLNSIYKKGLIEKSAKEKGVVLWSVVKIA